VSTSALGYFVERRALTIHARESKRALSLVRCPSAFSCDTIVEQGFDLQLRFGELPDARLAARLLTHNQRVLCAAPAYLRRAGEPAEVFWPACVDQLICCDGYRRSILGTLS
jgi:DNA-binding transcriptional LysR family regulator